MAMPPLPDWRDNQGELIACTEKIKVMTENIRELFQVAQDAFEDALLIGCDEQQLRSFFQELMTSLDNPYQQKTRQK